MTSIHCAWFWADAANVVPPVEPESGEIQEWDDVTKMSRVREAKTITDYRLSGI